MIVRETNSVSMTFEVVMDVGDLVELYRLSEKSERTLDDTLYDVVKCGIVELLANCQERKT